VSNSGTPLDPTMPTSASLPVSPSITSSTVALSSGSDSACDFGKSRSERKNESAKAACTQACTPSRYASTALTSPSHAVGRPPLA
jgi:hypothetical protein